MPDPVYGLTAGAAHLVTQMAADYQQQMPESGRRTRRAVNSTPIMIGIADSAITQGTSGTVSIWSGATSAGVADSTTNITAYARLGDVGSGKWVYVIAFGCGYEIIAAEC